MAVTIKGKTTYGPNIVTDGLVLYLDAANDKSFRGESTTNEVLSNIWSGDGGNQTDLIKGGETITNYTLMYNNYPTQLWTPGTSYNCYLNGVKINTSTVSTDWTFSCYIKREDGEAITNVNVYMYFPTSDGFQAGIIEDMGDGWYRVHRTRTGAESNITLVGLTSLVPGVKYYLSGPQLEKKSYPTPYIQYGTSRGTTVATGGGVIDISNKENHGELKNGITYNSNNKGSLVFNGINEYIDVGSSSDIILNTGGSICVWTKWSSYNGTSWSNTLVGKGGSSWPNHHYILFKESGTNHLLFSISNGTTYLATNGPSSRDIPLNSWFYAVATWDDTYKRLYYNSELEEEVNSVIMPIDSSAPVSIGRTGTNGYYLDGNIALVQIYNRSLTNLEVIQNYNTIKTRYNL
jgi:hypothetical protein